jgi:hypothetical protein
MAPGRPAVYPEQAGLLLFTLLVLGAGLYFAFRLVFGLYLPFPLVFG